MLTPLVFTVYIVLCRVNKTSSILEVLAAHLGVDDQDMTEAIIARGSTTEMGILWSGALVIRSWIISDMHFAICNHHKQ
jgi:hypothetical protein